MGLNSEEFDVIVYLVQVAPVVLIMGIAVKVLWGHNKELTYYIRQNDKDNLKTLQHLANAITKSTEDGNKHFNDLKQHVTERTNEISQQIKDSK